VEEAGRRRDAVALLRTHPRPVVSLAMVLTMGPVERYDQQLQARELFWG
jgi:hypothetical protein